MNKFVISASSTKLLSRLIFAHVLGTLFAYLVYARFTQLGDNYLPDNFLEFYRTNYVGTEIDSTIFTHGVYYYLGFLFPGLLAAMFLGVVTATMIWITFRDIYKYVNHWLFWICNLFPHFLIWSGSSSKEQLIIAGIIVINFAAKRSFDNKNLSVNFIFVLMAIYFLFFMKPNYFVMYFIVFIMALFSPWLHINFSGKLSYGVYY